VPPHWCRCEVRAEAKKNWVKRDRPSISVVIPCFGQAHFLPEALASVQAQTIWDWECIIVNDGSPDDTARVAAEWARRDARFRYIEKTNGGLSSARNVGISAARGEFILPLDADDLIADSYLEKGLGCFEGSAENLVVTCYVQYFGALQSLWKPPGTGMDYLVNGNTIVCSSIFTKRLWKSLNGYDEEMRHGFEDWDFWLRASNLGIVFKIIPEPLFKYRRSDASMVGEALSRRVEIVRYLVLKNGTIFQKHYAAAILGREREIAQLHSEIELARQPLLQSRDYRLGRALLSPVRWLKWRVFRKRCA
jgi:glycosyltransferase involved in cell wall biosynthesis